MAKYKTFGKTKLIILVIVFVVNLITPLQNQIKLNLLMAMIPPLILGIGVVSISFSRNRCANNKGLDWNDGIFSNWPFSFFHFGALFFLLSGIGMLINTLIKFHEFNTIGLVSLFLGIGLYLGILFGKMSKKS